MTLRQAWIGLGGNIGDVPATFRSALSSLGSCPGIRVVRVSRHYRTPAWGVTEQPDFINAVAEVASTLDPPALLSSLQSVERQHGRDRAHEQRWGPRTLDLDLLAIADIIFDSPALQVPHPRLADRAFVLVPWVEIAPDLALPGLGRIADLCDALDRSGIEAIP